MAEPGKPDKNDRGGPADPLASAAAVGFALAAQAAEFWLGVASGLAKAGQDMLERNRKSEDSPALTTEPTKPVEAARAAVRTVMADVERAAKDVAEVTSKLAPANVVAKPVEKKPEPKATEKSAPKATENKSAPKTTESKAAPKPAEGKAAPKAVEKPEQKVPERKLKLEAGAPAKPAAPKAKAVKAKADAAPQAVIMPEDFRAPKAMPRPAKPDDLKRLNGVGPRLEQTLNGLGVWTYAQVAAWKPEEIAYVEDMTGLDGAVATNKWLSQAASLAKGETKH